jgi:3-deoxy-manno-octulosonate cytidylyltransferase (CMP-KDO synthetase)
LKVIGVIPARFASTRFPGKVLAPIAGKPMIQHVYERARRAHRLAQTLIATDDERVLQAVLAFQGDARMTRSDHRTGTERVAEIAVQTEADIFVNIQGDEPLIEPAAIDAAVEALLEDSAIQVATLAVAIRNPGDIMDPNVVKVVSDFQGDALYFSRAPIPWIRDESGKVASQHFKHLGLYAFRRDILLEFPTLPPGQCEKLEQLEQLRLLENGYRIRVLESSHDSIGVDVPADLARIEQLLAAGPPEAEETP